MLEDRKPVDWVERRLQCGPEFIALALMDRVKSDVEKANFRRAPPTGFNDSGDSERFFVERKSSDQPDSHAVCFARESDKISITCNSKTHIVKWEWDMDAVTCRLTLDGKPSEFWKISQAVLYRKFFPQG